MDGDTEKITHKALLSMSTEELYIAHEEVSRSIDNLQTVIRSYKGHLSQLAPQLQAEQELGATYIHRNIKELPAGSRLHPQGEQGLQLKLFENGRDIGEITIYITKKELGASSSMYDSDEMMMALRQTIHQRLLCSGNVNPPGLNFKALRLFDEAGREIKNPLSLRNEQKIWLSYGDDYRSPVNPVLSLTLDRVAPVEQDGLKMVYRTLLDPDLHLPHRCKNWEVCVGFPGNIPRTNQQTYEHMETVDEQNHFLQSKVYPELVLYPSVTMEKKSSAPRPPRRVDQSEQTSDSTWPLSNVWLVTKTGMILSRALPQICLAVGQPIQLKTVAGSAVEGYQILLQKRDKRCIDQQWGFGKNGHIYSKAYPEFVLTYLEETSMREDLCQEENQIHQGLWSADYQDLDSSSSSEDFLNNVSDPSGNQVTRPLDTPPVAPGAPGRALQTAVALARILEDKHPRASAQRKAAATEEADNFFLMIFLPFI